MIKGLRQSKIPVIAELEYKILWNIEVIKIRLGIDSQGRERLPDLLEKTTCKSLSSAGALATSQSILVKKTKTHRKIGDTVQ